MTKESSLEIEEGTILTAQDRSILESIDHFHAKGLAVKRWWDQADAQQDYSQRFESVRTYTKGDHSFGFFGEAPLERGTMPVMGVVDEVFYDRPKGAPQNQTADPRWMKEQIREFVLHYFLRISDYRQSERVVEPGQNRLPPYLRILSWRPEQEVHRSGMEFLQRYYKSAASGKIGKFPAESENSVTDLREVGRKYDWIVLHLSIFDFNISLKPLGLEGPQAVLPLKEESYLLVSPEFVTDKEKPRPGILGEYGLGYTFIKNPSRGPFGYGPGEFEAAFQIINFLVHENGETWVRMAFVSNVPDKIVNLSLDPVKWSFRLADRLSFGFAAPLVKPLENAWESLAAPIGSEKDAVLLGVDAVNAITFGQAAKQLDISREQLNKGFLVRHSMQHYQTILGSLRTWRQIPDWLSNGLPDWVVTGHSS